ncbi:ABC transporter ATP-binding protein [Variovorax sp. Root434]|uniref:ABC transporter ATP-binding protein n=1 Tax=unclassified Variovorax TaxID=663243 RepID=UPI0006F6084B|nr:ABC transporter ATP-binding protein [Variovorax sp. Root434]KQX19874.1 ABC transporter ATP-binding protein [Variovorax sp. Root434]
MDTILEAHQLSRQFSGFFAVKNVDLRVRRHSVHALIGPNGAGKTTCFNLLTTFLRPSTGRVTFNGRDISRSDPASVAMAGLVRSFQISAVFGQMTVLENVRVALQKKAGGSFAFWRNVRVLRSLDARAMELLERVGLTHWRDTMAGELPYGRKRALELATTIAMDPEMILLDEPMAGLGHEDIGPVVELIRDAAKGRTVLMVEHNMKVIEALCDRVTVLQAGQVLAEGSYDEVSRDARVIEAYVGGAHA